MAVPLRIAGGSRLKILEGLSAGLPVVSTRVDAEGLSLQPGRDLVVVEDVADMAGALVQAMNNPEPVQAMARQGRQVVREQYDWTSLAEKLEQKGFDVKLPLHKIKPFRFPAGLSESVEVAGRRVALDVRAGTLRIDAAAVWVGARVAVQKVEAPAP